MAQSQVERIDLNLFRTFDVVMTTRSVAAAARELGLTASAVSHALTRLRALFDDDLFQASPTGMVPTPRALEVAPDISLAIRTLAATLKRPSFDPALSRRVFRVGASDYVSLVVLPLLLPRLRAAETAIRLRIVPMGRLDIVQQMDEGRLDLVIGWFGRMPACICRRPLYEEQEAIVVRADHPLTQGPMTVERLVSFPHVAVEFTGTEPAEADGFYDDRGVLRRVWVEHLLVDSRLVRDGEQHITLTVPGHGSIGPVVARSDLVASLPLRMAHRAVAHDGLALLPLPYEPLTVTVEMAWHERVDADDGLHWLREQFAAAAAALEAPSPDSVPGIRTPPL